MPRGLPRAHGRVASDATGAASAGETRNATPRQRALFACLIFFFSASVSLSARRQHVSNTLLDEWKSNAPGIFATCKGDASAGVRQQLEQKRYSEAGETHFSATAARRARPSLRRHSQGVLC